METVKKHNLIWESSPKLTLVLDQGALATSFYMPAMLGFNPDVEFGKNTFVFAQMVRGSNRPQIVCFVNNIDEELLEFIIQSENYSHREQFEVNQHMLVTRIFYNVPAELHEDYKFFYTGQYSKISLSSRERIRLVSGARYRVPRSDGCFIYDKKLLVLEKSQILRQYLERFLDVIIDEHAELLEIPGDDNYYVPDTDDEEDICVFF